MSENNLVQSLDLCFLEMLWNESASELLPEPTLTPRQGEIIKCMQDFLDAYQKVHFAVEEGEIQLRKNIEYYDELATQFGSPRMRMQGYKAAFALGINAPSIDEAKKFLELYGCNPDQFATSDSVWIELILHYNNRAARLPLNSGELSERRKLWTRTPSKDTVDLTLKQLHVRFVTERVPGVNPGEDGYQAFRTKIMQRLKVSPSKPGKRGAGKNAAALFNYNAVHLKWTEMNDKNS